MKFSFAFCASIFVALLLLSSGVARAFPQEDSAATQAPESMLLPGTPCPQSLDSVLTFLKSDGAWTRATAAECLGEMKDGRAAEPLVHAIFVEKYPRMVLYERDALRKINNPRTGDLLLEALNSKETRWIAAYSLGDLQISRGVELLLALLQYGDKEDRRTAADALGSMKDIRAIDLLIAALKQNDELLRRYAASSLGTIGDARAGEALIAAIDDPDDGVRWNAANSLGELKDSSAVPALAQRLADADEERNVRMASAESLGKIADIDAVRLLIAGLMSNSKFVQWYSAKALAPIQQQQVAQAFAESLRQGNINVAAAAYPVFIRAGDQEFVPALIEALNGYGDSDMIADYLFSGNAELAAAANRLASEKGLEDLDPQDREELIWGSQK